MRKHFDFYGYNSPTSGKYYIDGNEYFSGEDFRTVKRYKEYKNAGFTILLLQHENSYSGEDFETSACNLCMEKAFAAGIDKIIVSDTRLKELCTKEKLVGDGGEFLAEEDFISYLDFCTKPYRNKAGFYGIQLFDEPPYKYLVSYGKVYRGLKKILPEAFLQCNLLNIVEKERLTDGDEELYDAYEKYLNKFLDESGADSLMYDDYPFRRDYLICGNSLPNYRIAAEVCKKRKIEFHTVLQSFAWVTDGRLVMRGITEPDMRWQMNMCLAFGVREFAFFTYFTKQNVKLKGGLSTDGVDGAAFVNRDGTRTKLYRFAKKIIAETKASESVFLRYGYENSYIFCADGKTEKDFEQTEYARFSENCPINAKPDKGVVLVSEHVGADGKSKLFVVENIGNIKDEFHGETPQKINLSLGENASDVKIYKRGKQVKRNITDGRFTETLSVGDAIFIETTNV